MALRKQLKEKLKSAGVSTIDIERAANKLVIRIHTARPGIIIGRKGSEIDKLKRKCRSGPSAKCTSIFRKCTVRNWTRNWWRNRSRCNLKSAWLSAGRCAKSVDSALRFGCKGIKVRVAGRLNGAEIARKEWYLQGRLPLQTLRADIDYGFAEAHTTYGVIGVKCWIYQGENIPERGKAQSGRGVSSRKHRSAKSGNDRDTIMLMPKKVKYRKQQRGRRNGKAWRGGVAGVWRVWIEGAGAGVDYRPADRSVARGDHPIHQARRKTLDPRFFRISHSPRSRRKPAWARAKGAPEHWVAVVKPGRVMFEMAGVDLASATEAMELAAHKLPIRTKFVTRAEEL